MLGGGVGVEGSGVVVVGDFSETGDAAVSAVSAPVPGVGGAEG